MWNICVFFAISPLSRLTFLRNYFGDYVRYLTDIVCLSVLLSYAILLAIHFAIDIHVVPEGYFGRKSLSMILVIVALRILLILEV